MTLDCSYCKSKGTNTAQYGPVPCGECEGTGRIEVCDHGGVRLLCDGTCPSEECKEVSDSTCDHCGLHFDICACHIDPTSNTEAK